MNKEQPQSLPSSSRLWREVPVSEMPKEKGWYNLITDALPHACGRAFFDGKKFNLTSSSATDGLIQNGFKLFWLELQTQAPALPVHDADNISIDLLLSEFKRQGFDTSNWDGDEGAEKAIVDGIINHIYDREQERQEWADMCIRKQLKIEELENRIQVMKINGFV